MPRVYTGPRGGKYVLVKGRRRYLPKKRKGRKRGAKKGSGGSMMGDLNKRTQMLRRAQTNRYKDFLLGRKPKKKPKKGSNAYLNFLLGKSGSGGWSYHIEPGEVRWFD